MELIQIILNVIFRKPCHKIVLWIPVALLIIINIMFISYTITSGNFVTIKQTTVAVPESVMWWYKFNKNIFQNLNKNKVVLVIENYAWIYKSTEVLWVLD